MDATTILLDFFDTIADDPRICPVHIAIYLALLGKWQESDCGTHLETAAYEIMRVCKVQDRGTYLKRLKELADFGYIQYQPAENEYIKAVIRFKRL